MYLTTNILMQKIKLNIANRIYPLNVNPSQEEILRKASKQINDMVNEYEKKYAVQDKQDTLAMCALQIISQSEKFSKSERNSINEINDKLNSINDLVIQSLDS